MTNTPAVSVIIPMFNAAKYVGQCLESILAQTFTDFEVIIVDDCSTDSSCAVVESFAPKFNGRLALLQLDRNTGSGSVPRNTGLKFARGEYVFNMDNDDLLTLTALEELYTLAKDFDADVVYCERYYEAAEDLGKIFITSEQQGTLVDKPTFETENFEERLNKILRYSFMVMPWTKLVKRDLLIEHENYFPQIYRDDEIWTWNLVFHAKRFLRVPNVVYVYRQTKNSITRKKKTPQETINFWLNPVVCGTNTLNDFLNRVEFFRQNPRRLHQMLFYFVEASFNLMLKESLKLEPFEVFESIREKFSQELNGNVPIPLLCSFVNAQQRVITAKEREISELKRKLKEKLS